MTRKPGEWLHLNDEDLLFFFGPGREFPEEAGQPVPRAFKRVVADSGMGRSLATYGVSPDDLPDDAPRLDVSVTARLGGVSIGAADSGERP